MNVEMILASTKVVGLVLSFTLLLRARQLSVGLWSAAPYYQRLPTGSVVEQQTEMDRRFRA
jgi:hypothetical protein